MPYIEANIVIPSNTETGREITIAELGRKGFESFQETETGMKAYIRENDYSPGLLEDLIVFSSNEFKGSSITVDRIEDINWNAEWERNFSPVAVSDFCYIRSPFHKASGKHTYEVVIEPKMSFGTGHHATTWLMINSMKQVNFIRKKVLDVGCGTAVLSILASLMDASKISAIDIDEWAYQNSVENLKVNHVSNCDLIHGNINDVKENDYDIILANITRNILSEDMPEYASRCNQDGYLILSGFYEADIVLLKSRALECGFSYIEHSVRERWASILFTRKQ